MSRRRHEVAIREGFGSRLTEVLADQRVSQQALAEKLHASPSFVSSLVRGLKAPGADFMVSLHEALGVSVNWLLLGKGHMYGDEVDSDLLQSALLQVQLARLATSEKRPEAAALLRNALPGLDLPAPSPTPTDEDLTEFLDVLVKSNQDLPVAISLVNRTIMRAQSQDRSRAIADAIRELVRSKLSPSILGSLKPATSHKGRGGTRSSDDNINWGNEPLPAERKVGDRLGRRDEAAEAPVTKPLARQKARRVKR